MTFCKLKVLESDFNRQNKKFMPQIPHTVVRKTTGSLTNAVRLGLIGQHMNIFRNFSRAVLHGEPLIAPGAEASAASRCQTRSIYPAGWIRRSPSRWMRRCLRQNWRNGPLRSGRHGHKAAAPNRISFCSKEGGGSKR